MNKINIPEKANEIIHTLQKHGHKAYVVGGCVRDSLLGRTPHDWDICTSAKPEEILSIFRDRKTLNVGIKHGTVNIMDKGVPYEVTTFRIDGIYSDGRRPDGVTFTDSLTEDLKRRDFTINAIAYNDEEGIIDPFNGQEDIEDGIIRCVGSAEERFSEDALRMLRALRFSAQLDFPIELKTAEELHKNPQRLDKISQERINSELCKIAVTENFAWEIEMYKEIFEQIIPEIKEMEECKQNNPFHIYDVFEHTLGAVNAYTDSCDKRDLITSLSVLFHDFGKPQCKITDENGIDHFKGHAKVSVEMTDEIMKRLRFDNKTRGKVTELVLYHDAAIEPGVKYINRWLNKIGEEQFRRLLNVRRADIMSQTPDKQEERLKEVDDIEAVLEEAIKEKNCFSMKDLAVNGKDLIAAGIRPGKELGETLNCLLQAVIDGECRNDREELLKLMKEFVQQKEEQETEIPQKNEENIEH